MFRIGVVQQDATKPNSREICHYIVRRKFMGRGGGWWEAVIRGSRLLFSSRDDMRNHRYVM